MFILNPDTYSLPCYRIGPFTTSDIKLHAALPQSNRIDEYFNTRFDNNNFLYTENGRKAINLALSYYTPGPKDVVTILTTSGNFYISGCVTKEIENFCSWSRKMEANTKLIFVNHEFGYPYPGLRDLKKYNLPVIEDCANTFFSIDEDNSIGTVGDFVIYSFPKIFPIQVGGLLKSNLPHYQAEYYLEPELKQYIKNVLSKYIPEEDIIKQKRIHNYAYLQKRFSSLGFNTRFELCENIVPGVFMFRVDNEKTDLPLLKNHFYAHGIQCSVFYGERSFFIPCHQNLDEADLDYFAVVMQAFMKNNN